MVPSVPEGPLSQSINWTENRPAGHQQVAAFILIESIDEMKGMLEQSGKYAVAADQRNPFAKLLIQTFTGESTKAGLTIIINAGALYDSVYLSLAPKFRMPNFPATRESSFAPIRFKDLAMFDDILGFHQRGGVVTNFFRRFPDPSKLTPVTDKRARGR
jgi:hypothetical protein